MLRTASRNGMVITAKEFPWILVVGTPVAAILVAWMLYYVLTHSTVAQTENSLTVLAPAAGMPLAEAPADAAVLEGLAPRSALVWQPSRQLAISTAGEVVLEGAEILATNQHYFFQVPASSLPLRLGVIGYFAVVKPDAVRSSLGIQTGEVFLFGGGEGRYKFFPVDETGERTIEPPIFVTITVTTGGETMYWSADLLPAEKEG